MNLLAVAIIFGLVYPVYNYLANVFMGSLDDDIKAARSSYVENHLAASLFGCLMSFATPIAYWILVLIYFVL